MVQIIYHWGYVEMETKARFCANCGSKLLAEADYCSSCGTATKDAATPASEPSVVAKTSEAQIDSKRLLRILGLVSIFLGAIISCLMAHSEFMDNARRSIRQAETLMMERMPIYILVALVGAVVGAALLVATRKPNRGPGAEVVKSVFLTLGTNVAGWVVLFMVMYSAGF